MSAFGTRRLELFKALLKAFPDPEGVRRLARFALEVNLQEHVPAGGDLRDWADALITQAEDMAKELELLETAVGLNPGSPELRAVCDSLRDEIRAVQGSYRPPNPIDTCLVRRRRAFIGRDDLRTSLRELMASDGARSLVVRGDSRSGRTFTAELLKYVAMRSGGHKVVPVDLVETGPDLAPDGLVRLVALGALGHTEGIPPQRDEQWPRWNLELCYWLANRVEQTGKTVWIVVDAIDKVRPRDDTMDLMWKLALHAERNPGRLRVVLLACSEVPEELADDVLEETIGAVVQADLVTYFDTLLAHRGGELRDGAVQEAVENVLAQLAAREPWPASSLGRVVSQVANRLAEDAR